MSDSVITIIQYVAAEAFHIWKMGERIGILDLFEYCQSNNTSPVELLRRGKIREANLN